MQGQDLACTSSQPRPGRKWQKCFLLGSAFLSCVVASPNVVFVAICYINATERHDGLLAYNKCLADIRTRTMNFTVLTPTT